MPVIWGVRELREGWEGDKRGGRGWGSSTRGEQEERVPLPALPASQTQLKPFRNGSCCPSTEVAVLEGDKMENELFSCTVPSNASQDPPCPTGSPAEPSQPAPGSAVPWPRRRALPSLSVRKNECLCNDWGGKRNGAHLAEVALRGSLERRLPATYLRASLGGWHKHESNRGVGKCVWQSRTGWCFPGVCRKSTAVAALCGVWPVQPGG